MKRIAILLCLPLGLPFTLQAKSQKVFADTAIKPYTGKGERPRRGWSWMKQRKHRKASRKAAQQELPGAVITATDANTFIPESKIYGDYDGPEKGWTSRHQQIYNDLLSGNVTLALDAVLKLKKEGYSVTVPVPGDIQKRTLHAVAFDMDREFFNDDLELNKNWEQLIKELKSNN